MHAISNLAAAHANGSARNLGALGMAHLRDLAELVGSVDPAALDEAVARVRRARRDGATVFVAGNGGSAATASHWVNDLCKATRCAGQPLVRATCLSDNTSWLTALANDEGYERVFAAQLENLGRAGDVLIVISASGNSPNLVAAVETAQQLGMDTIGMLGFDGGVLRERVDGLLWLPTERGLYELVEDAHSALCHAVTVCLKAEASRDDLSA
jgi:D-sedoheptulose 7-phosphate isomerase